MHSFSALDWSFPSSSITYSQLDSHRSTRVVVQLMSKPSLWKRFEGPAENCAPYFGHYEGSTKRSIYCECSSTFLVINSVWCGTSSFSWLHYTYCLTERFILKLLPPHRKALFCVSLYTDLYLRKKDAAVFESLHIFLQQGIISGVTFLLRLKGRH